MKFLITIFLIATSLYVTVAQGQQVQSFLQPSLQNPASMGRSKNINVSLFAQHDMAGFEGRRPTVACAGDFPIVYNRTYRELYKKYMFIGFSFQNENYSIYNNFSAIINYAYRLQVAKEHYLSFGVAAGILDQFKNYAHLLSDGTSDPAVLERMRNEKKNAVYFKGGVGIELHNPRYYVAVFVPDFINEISPFISGGFTTNPETNCSFAFDAKTGYDFTQKKFIQELKMWLTIKQTIGFGFGYGYPQQASAFAFINLKKFTKIGYGCQINHFKFKVEGAPVLTHEIMLKLTFICYPNKLPI
ncbi:MAG: PorP/SprF family type IX secretion system membrane protein [Bacteroidales bacterium]|jgi:type IX secretion system PorP/SprF family membrane protein|nr:PorP/SprF family type IX secretion system membrane protein [Bacteroidales bacterium]